jgi:hypothetical protein
LAEPALDFGEEGEDGEEHYNNECEITYNAYYKAGTEHIEQFRNIEIVGSGGGAQHCLDCWIVRSQ